MLSTLKIQENIMKEILLNSKNLLQTYKQLNYFKVSFLFKTSCILVTSNSLTRSFFLGS